jgi:hypothetical protein
LTRRGIVEHPFRSRLAKAKSSKVCATCTALAWLYRTVPFLTSVVELLGWDEGVMKMSLGEKAMLRITSDYGKICWRLFVVAGAAVISSTPTDRPLTTTHVCFTCAPTGYGSQGAGGVIVRSHSLPYVLKQQPTTCLHTL